jgi:putative tricarboxylic transport membrane protein
MMTTPSYKTLRAQRGLFPFELTGAKLDAYIKQRVGYYRTLARDFGLNVVPAK